MFVVFEGIDGSGKTTVINKLQEALKAMFVPCLVTAEPYKYRDMVFNAKDPLEELALWLADRRAHIHEVIEPNESFSPSTVLLCDRFTDSTLAYQNAGSGINFEFIQYLNSWFAYGINPDRIYYLDVDISTAMNRVISENKYDNQNYNWYYNVHTAYLRAFENRPNVVKINANQSIERVTADVLTDLMKYMENVFTAPHPQRINRKRTSRNK